MAPELVREMERLLMAEFAVERTGSLLAARTAGVKASHSRCCDVRTQ